MEEITLHLKQKRFKTYKGTLTQLILSHLYPIYTENSSSERILIALAYKHENISDTLSATGWAITSHN